jgi:hypothetical protein
MSGGISAMATEQPQAQVPEKPEEVISNQIINELNRVHMRIPRY